MFESWRKNFVSHFDELRTAERQGAKKNALEIAGNLIRNLGLPPEIVAENTGISLEEVLAIQQLTNER